MTISTGDTLPEGNLIKMGAEGPETVSISELTKGKRVVLFGLPGAFTGTCSAEHLPSFIRTKDAFAEKGIDTIICFAVNDPFVMAAWAKAQGADEAGIHMLADGDGAFTKALGLDFDAPPVAFYGRCNRTSMIVDDGKVTVMHSDVPGTCDATAGENLLKEA